MRDWERRIYIKRNIKIKYREYGKVGETELVMQIISGAVKEMQARNKKGGKKRKKKKQIKGETVRGEEKRRGMVPRLLSHCCCVVPAATPEVSPLSCRIYLEKTPKMNLSLSCLWLTLHPVRSPVIPACSHPAKITFFIWFPELQKQPVSVANYRSIYPQALLLEMYISTDTFVLLTAVCSHHPCYDSFCWHIRILKMNESQSTHHFYLTYCAKFTCACFRLIRQMTLFPSDPPIKAVQSVILWSASTHIWM